MRVIGLIFFLFCISDECYAGKYVYEYDTNCSKAYRYYLSLQADQGSAVLRTELSSKPNNLFTIYIKDYEDCLSLLMNGDRREYERVKGHFDEEISALGKGDPNSPWYRVCQAGVNLHWALIYFRFGDNTKAAFAFRRSYLQIKENEQIFPGFEYNKVFSGLGETLSGTIPDNYKWIASLFGLKGSVKKGSELLSGFIKIHNSKDPLYAEALIYYTYMRFYFLSEKEEAWTDLEKKRTAEGDKLMSVFIKANIAVNYRKADAALQVLNEVEAAKGYLQYPILDFEKGSALLNKLDTNCLYYFQRFLKNYKGTAFIKDTWQMMALMYHIQGKAANAKYCKEYILTHGARLTDADKQAERFAENSQWPDKMLLQVRLLIDGGYYTAALARLGQVNENSFSIAADKTEYLFRMGRVYEELKENKNALDYYQKAINKGKYRPEHFAARAALQMAFIYEKTGMQQEARNRYEEVLSMHNHDFQSSLDQQAKAGINRLHGVQ